MVYEKENTMKPTFNSKNFLFRETSLGSALKEAGLIHPMALIREPVLEVQPKKGKPYVVNRAGNTPGAFGRNEVAIGKDKAA